MGENQDMHYPNSNNLKDNDGPFHFINQQRIHTRVDIEKNTPTSKQKDRDYTKQEVITLMK